MDTRALLDEGWSAIVDRFVTAIETVASGGSAGAWRSGLRAIAGTDYLNAVTGKPYRGAFNRATLSARLGPRLDRRVATARQLETAGYPHPAVHGIASDAVILAPIAHRSKTEDEEEEGAGRVTFRPACVYGVDRLRSWRGPNGEGPWAELPPCVELPQDEWTKGHEDGALSLIPSLTAALGIRLETGLVKAPHVAFDGKEAVVRMPDPAQQEGSEEIKLANRLSSFFHEAAHWTGYGGADESMRRTMTGDFGSADYAREELVALS